VLKDKDEEGEKVAKKLGGWWSITW
jgi:hypothetical protein